MNGREFLMTNKVFYRYVCLFVRSNELKGHDDDGLRSFVMSGSFGLFSPCFLTCSGFP